MFIILKMIVRIRFLLLCSLVVFSHAVDYDYFFNPLRSKKVVPCTSKDDKVTCHLKCNMDTGGCVRNKCYCLWWILKGNDIKDFRDIAQEILLKIRGDVQSLEDFHDYGQLSERKSEIRNIHLEIPEYLDETLLLDSKPVLRHHIAHFCPNLDLARTCIRTCMKEGKPAFCGKDHVCYCGHRYSHTDKDSNINASSIYSEFQDMYEKYFGPDYKQQINV